MALSMLLQFFCKALLIKVVLQKMQFKEVFFSVIHHYYSPYIIIIITPSLNGFSCGDIISIA